MIHLAIAPGWAWNLPWWAWLIVFLVVGGAGYATSEVAKELARSGRKRSGLEILGPCLSLLGLVALVFCADVGLRDGPDDYEGAGGTYSQPPVRRARPRPDEDASQRGFTNPWTAEDPEVWVRPHLREGRYVEGHWRTRPGAPGR